MISLDINGIFIERRYLSIYVSVEAYLLIFYHLILFQAPEDCALAITSIIRHHETEYLASLEVLTLSSCS